VYTFRRGLRLGVSPCQALQALLAGGLGALAFPPIRVFLSKAKDRIVVPAGDTFIMMRREVRKAVIQFLQMRNVDEGREMVGGAKLKRRARSAGPSHFAQPTISRPSTRASR
jgi:hypothetical protein